jgi:hypothetical protein
MFLTAFHYFPSEAIPFGSIQIAISIPSLLTFAGK